MVKRKIDGQKVLDWIEKRRKAPPPEPLFAIATEMELDLFELLIKRLMGKS